MTSATCGTRSNVKASLTPTRRRRVVENDQYAAFVRRVIAAYSRRVAAGDVDAISDMTRLAAELDDAISQAVLDASVLDRANGEIMTRYHIPSDHVLDDEAVVQDNSTPAPSTTTAAPIVAK